MSFISFTQPNGNNAFFDDSVMEQEELITEVKSLNNTSFNQTNYKQANNIQFDVPEDFLLTDTFRDDFPDINLSAAEDEELESLILNLESEKLSSKFENMLENSPNVHSQVGTPLWSQDPCLSRTESNPIPIQIMQFCEFKGFQLQKEIQREHPEEFSFESIVQSDKPVTCKDQGSRNSSFDWSRRSTKTQGAQQEKVKMNQKKAVLNGRNTTFGTLSTSKDSGNLVQACNNPFFGDPNQDHSWLDQGVNSNNSSFRESEDKNLHVTFLSDRPVEKDLKMENRRDMTIEPKNFRFVVRASEKIVDTAFGLNKEENKKDPRDAAKSLNDYIRDYEKLVKDNQRITHGKGDPLVQGGKEIYDEIIRMKQSMSEMELQRRILNCRIEMPLPMIELQVREFLKPRNIEPIDVLRHPERKTLYTTFKSFEDCYAEEEIFRRWMISSVARKWMVTQDTPLHLHSLQGDHGAFILSVLQGDLSIDNRIRMLDFKCKGTRHVNLALEKIEQKFRAKLEKINSGWGPLLERISHLIGLGSADSCTVVSDKSSVPDTRSQTIGSPMLCENEQKANVVKKGKAKSCEILNDKTRRFQGKFIEIFQIIRQLEAEQRPFKEVLKTELMRAKDFVSHCTKKLGSKKKGGLSENEVDNLIMLGDMCYLMLVNAIKYQQMARFSSQKGASKLEKRSFDDIGQFFGGENFERDDFKRLKM